jgi:hypothetical protein
VVLRIFLLGRGVGTIAKNVCDPPPPPYQAQKAPYGAEDEAIKNESRCLGVVPSAKPDGQSYPEGRGQAQPQGIDQLTGQPSSPI